MAGVGLPTDLVMTQARQNLGAVHSKADTATSAKEYEAMFVSTLFKQMYSQSHLGASDLQPTTGEGIYRDMLMDQYGKMVADNGGIGIADHVQKSLLRLQEAR